MALSMVTIVLSVQGTGPEGPAPYWAFVEVGDVSDLQHVASALRGEGIELGTVFRYIPFLEARITSERDLDRVLSVPGVVGTMEQMPVSPAMNVSVRAMRAERSELYSPETARDLGYTGKGITIAILDGGVDNEHPTFEGAFVAGADFSNMGIGKPKDGTFDPDDIEGHGTSVASVALGRGDGNGDFKGMAPEAGLIDLRIRALGPTLPGPMAEAIEWCITNKDTDWGNGYTGVDIISISAGLGQAGGAVDQAVTRAVSEGLTVISAATNSGTSFEENPNARNDYWPDDSIIAGGTETLGTVDRSDDVFWDQSTWGPRTPDGDDDFYDELKPDASAPGADLLLAAYSRNSDTTPASGYVVGSGTSFSTPHLSGMAALMLEANPGLVPDATINPVRLALHRSSEARGTVYDQDMSLKYDVHYGYGIIDAYEAVRAAKDFRRYESGPTVVGFTSEASKVTAGGTVLLSALAIDDQEQPMTYVVTSEEGTAVHGEAPRTWQWTAPETPGVRTITLEVTDVTGLAALADLEIEVVEGATNEPPTIEGIEATKTLLETGGECDIRVQASDPDGDDLSYFYEPSIGTIAGEGHAVTYTAPDFPGTAVVRVTVTDPFGAKAKGEVTISVEEEVFGDPPTIVDIEFDPPAFKSGYSGPVTVYVTVMKNTYDILYVTVDLSAMLLGEIALSDGGNDPDMEASDRTYSAYLGDLSAIDDGRYDVVVTVGDVAGFRSTSTAELVIDRPSPDDGGVSLLTGAVSLVGGIAIILLMVAIVAFVAMRLARKA